MRRPSGQMRSPHASRGHRNNPAFHRSSSNRSNSSFDSGRTPRTPGRNHRGNGHHHQHRYRHQEKNRNERLSPPSTEQNPSLVSDDESVVSDSELKMIKVTTWDDRDRGSGYSVSADKSVVEHNAFAWRTIRAGPWVDPDKEVLCGSFETNGFGVVGVITDLYTEYNGVMGWDPHSWGYHAYGAVWHNNAKIRDGAPYLNPRKFRISVEIKRRLVTYKNDKGHILYKHKLPHKCGRVSLAMSSLANGAKARIVPELAPIVS